MSDLIANIKNKLEAEGEDTMMERLQHTAIKLFNIDMQSTGSAMTWNKSPERVKQLYFMYSRDYLMQGMITAETDSISSENANVDDQNDARIGHNSPELFKYCDRQGQEIFSIHRTVDGEVDITLNSETSYTKAALAILQMTFEAAAKTKMMNFSRALELMKRGYKVRSAANTDIIIWIDKSKGDPYIVCEPYEVFDNLYLLILLDDLEVCGKVVMSEKSLTKQL